MSRRMDGTGEAMLVIGGLFVAFTAAFAMIYVVGLRYAWGVGCLVGGVLIAYGARALLRAVSVASWPRVGGRILESGLGEQLVPMKYSVHTDYYPVVTFEYESPSGRFTSRRFTIAPRDYRNRDQAESERLIARYPVGAAVDVRVHPRDHRLAVLCAEVSRRRRSQYWAALVGGALVCGFSLWVAVSVMA